METRTGRKRPAVDLVSRLAKGEVIELVLPAPVNFLDRMNAELRLEGIIEEHCQIGDWAILVSNDPESRAKGEVVFRYYFEDQRDAVMLKMHAHG